MGPRRLISTCNIVACIATSSPSSPGYYAPPLSTPLIPRRRHERSTPPPLPPSSMPSVFLDIKGGMPTVSQSSGLAPGGVQRRCAWAVGRLGVHACLACFAAVVDNQARRFCLVRRSHCTAGYTPTQTRHRTHLSGLSGRLNSHRHTRHDKTVLYVSCLACYLCELDNCYINVFYQRQSSVFGNPIHTA